MAVDCFTPLLGFGYSKISETNPLGLSDLVQNSEFLFTLSDIIWCCSLKSNPWNSQSGIKPTSFRRVFFKNCLYWMRRGWAKNAGKCRTAVSIQGGGYLHSGSPPEAHWREAHCDTQPLPAWCKPKPKPWTLAHSLFNAVLSTYLNLSQIQRLSNSHWTSENILFQKSDRLDPMKRLICPL